MLAEVKGQTRGADKLVERQMRNWEIARAQKTSGTAEVLQQVEPFLTVSRNVGLSGLDVAQQIAARLGWPVFDKELLQHMAGDDAVRRRLYELMDGRDLTWLESCLRPLGVTGAERDDYFHRLSETILSLARKGRAVFVGRGADLILPREMGLRIRLTASRAYCTGQFAAAHGLQQKQAEKQIADIERERTAFIHRHFHVDAGDPTRFDLCLNCERLAPEEVAELVLAAMRLRRMIE